MLLVHSTVHLWTQVMHEDLRIDVKREGLSFMWPSKWYSVVASTKFVYQCI